MSESTERGPGTVGWIDLTVPEAEPVRRFYEQVVGWQSQPIDMKGYDDFVMMPAGSSDGVAGICHARGSNSSLPPVWMIYIMVENLDESLKRSAELGGGLVLGPKDAGGSGRYAVIRDPAGAVCALFEAKRS